MKIYFAHAKEDYNTEFEQQCLNKIKEQYPNYIIINPRDIKIDGEQIDPKNYTKFMARMNKYFFSEILKCCVLIGVVSSRTGKISQGVMKEIQFAIKHDIKVISLHNLCQIEEIRMEY